MREHINKSQVQNLFVVVVWLVGFAWVIVMPKITCIIVSFIS